MATINPFQGPINYSVDVQSPFEAALGGFKIGAAGAEIQAQQQAQQKAKTYQTGIDAFFAKPAEQRTYSDLEPLLVGANKQQFDALQAVAKGMGEQKLDSSKRFTGQLLVALEQNPETAKTLLNQRIEAETDPQQKLAWQDTLKTIDISPAKAANTVELLGAATFGKDWYESITKVRSERRTAEGAPAELRRKLADASKAESDAVAALATADNAQDVAKANADLVKAQAKSAQIKAEYAQTNEILDVQTKGRQLNLTDAQIKQALAAIRASDAAAKKSGADATLAQNQANEIAAGIIPVDKRPEAEAKFRKEYSDQTKGYQDVKSAYGRILAVSDPKTPDEEAPADLALVFNFMKMQDPGSTVNSGEFANAQNAAGVPDRIKNLYNNLITGGRLNPTQRKAFRGQAENLFKVSGQQEDTVRKGIGRIAKGYGLNTENIFYTSTEVAPTPLRPPEASGNSVTVNGKTYTRPANFTDAQWGAYKQSMGVQ
jgi:hypothetical protein